MTNPLTSLPSVKPASNKRCYVGVRDPKTKQSAHTTVYGLDPDEVVEALRLGVEEFKRRLPDAA